MSGVTIRPPSCSCSAITECTCRGGVELEEDPAFYLQDRFAILGGVYPPDRCGEYFDEAESKGYMTTLDAVHAILSCLSGGQNALMEPRRDRFLEGLEEHDYHYQEFLYE